MDNTMGAELGSGRSTLPSVCGSSDLAIQKGLHLRWSCRYAAARRCPGPRELRGESFRQYLTVIFSFFFFFLPLRTSIKLSKLTCQLNRLTIESRSRPTVSLIVINVHWLGSQGNIDINRINYFTQGIKEGNATHRLHRKIREDYICNCTLDLSRNLPKRAEIKISQSKGKRRI